jgi:hypothetical protein
MKAIIYLSFVFLSACTSPDSKEIFSKSSFDSSEPNQVNYKPELLESGDYIKWIENEENGLLVKKTLGDFTFSLQYKPLDYVALSHFKRSNIKNEEFEKKKNEFEGMQYFTLRVQSASNKNFLKAGIQSKDEEYARLQYFAFNMQNDLTLIDGKDTLKCVLHHFERTYNITPYADFVIGFESGNKGSQLTNNDKVLIYNDQVLNLGTIKIKINKQSLNRIPTLIYNTNEPKS